MDSTTHDISTPDASAGKRATTCRMFESDFIERFSRIHPATPFVFWLPVFTYLMYLSTKHAELGAFGRVGIFLFGLFAWTLAEYLLHRYLFHWINDTPRGKRIHFLLHGVHHDYPSDKDRLVMPLGFSIPMGVLFYTIFHFTFGDTFGMPFFCGFGLGYLMYDGVHYAVHHFKQTTRIGKYVKKHHMIHHHADSQGGFGVSTPLWDVVFRSMPKRKTRAVAA
jgi:sterol desaturase/sphingolipid hydroxylase (fatty acid hydroxylase superfamily)